MTWKNIAICVSSALIAANSTFAYADAITEALLNGKTQLNANLRYEMVDQDNRLKDADALSLRTRLTYSTGSVSGFSSLIEFEDSRTVLGVDDYNNTLGEHTQYSVIADPESTELDQLFVQYKQDGLGIKMGRQVITMDNHRFVGHVGWRQDRQTFDGATFFYQPMDNLTLKYGYLSKRNRIFAQGKDIDAKDHLINVAYKSSVGTLSAYGYLLEVDNNTNNALDTYGFRFNGAAKAGGQKLTYMLEYATQDEDSQGISYSADYLAAELGTSVSKLAIKLGYERLGSDNGEYGFATPLATLHKFNGWSDQFLVTPKEGLADLYASFSGKAAGGKWSVIYHKFDADEGSDNVDDLGSEIDAVYTKALSKYYTLGVKYAAYSAGDSSAGKVDTDKIWLWLNAKF
ncbi:alginate export family protein [Thalassotalea atypica]|uniref:alginate export family protein n=1 Tax=Thalassotalea atypica TaxID=2054316 RepID=UPI00257271F7|nr:alginate export family protein [Thalassotalea atypica]